MRVARLSLLPVLATLLVAGGCGGDDDSATTTETATGSPNETVRVPLAALKNPAGAKGMTLTVANVTVAVGDALEVHIHEGTQIAYIDSGVLTYSVVEGEVPVMSGSPEDDPEIVRVVKAGETAEIEPGQWVVEEESDVHMGANEGDVPVELAITTLLRNGADASTPAK